MSLIGRAITASLNQVTIIYCDFTLFYNVLITEDSEIIAVVFNYCEKCNRVVLAMI